jgi:hypothetical protein
MTELPPVKQMPQDAKELSVTIMGEATGYETDSGSLFAEWFGAAGVREYLVRNLGSVMARHRISLSPEWETALRASLTAPVEDRLGSRSDMVWSTGMAAVHDGILRSRNMPGIEAGPVHHVIFPYEFIEYYCPDGATPESAL